MATPATVYAGLESSYDASKVIVRHLDAHLSMTDPKEFPLLKAVGLDSFPETVDNKYIEWQFDYLMPLTDVLAVAITTTTATQITVTYAEYFALHDVILIDSELLRVLAIDTTSNYLTVDRGFAGSTAATHVISSTIYRLGPARQEGSSPGWAQQVVTAQIGGYTQIFDTYADISGTEEAQKNYAPDALLEYRIDKRMDELYMRIERALLYNSKSYAGTATNKVRLSGGLEYWVYDKNNIASAALQFADIEDAMEDVFGRAGMVNVPSQLWCNSYVVRKITQWGAGAIRTGRTETTYGNIVNTLVTNFGTLSINLDHLILSAEAWLLNIDEVQMGPMQGRAFQEWDATQPGDDMRASRILGEYIFVVKGEDTTQDGLHVKLYGISTTL